MLNVKDTSLLLQINKYCQRIINKTNCITKDNYSKNLDLQEIVCFNLLQIGELFYSKKFKITSQVGVTFLYFLINQ